MPYSPEAAQSFVDPLYDALLLFIQNKSLSKMEGENFSIYDMKNGVIRVDLKVER